MICNHCGETLVGNFCEEPNGMRYHPYCFRRVLEIRAGPLSVQVEDELSTLRARLAEVTAERDSLQGENTDLLASLCAKSRESQAESARLAEAEKECAGMKSARDALGLELGVCARARDDARDEVSDLRAQLQEAQARETKWIEFSTHFHTKGCSYIGNPEGLNCCQGSDAALNGMTFWAQRDESRALLSAATKASETQEARLAELGDALARLAEHVDIFVEDRKSMALLHAKAVLAAPDAGSALLSRLERLETAARAARDYLDSIAPKPSHSGACTPESGCDCACMDAAHYVGSHEWKVRNALAAALEDRHE